MKKFFDGRSKVLFVSTIVAFLYTIYLIAYVSSAMSSAKDSAEALGVGIAAALLTPHMIMLAIGTLFSFIALLTKKSWAALVALILFIIGAIVFLLYIMFTLPIIILSIFGYTNQRKLVDNK